MSVFLRSARGQDLPYIYEICLKTGKDGKDASDMFYDPYLLGHYYGAPYLFYEKSACFVSGADHVPQGYILSALDTSGFNEWMETVWLPPLREQYPEPYPEEKIRSPSEKRLVSLINRPAVSSEPPAWIAAYPAHLHIDLLPCLQGRGLGKALMEALFVALEKKNIPGIHLGVSMINTGAIAFYKKIGFSVLEAEPWGFCMGKKI